LPRDLEKTPDGMACYVLESDQGLPARWDEKA
jgi:hypothetical protein